LGIKIYVICFCFGACLQIERAFSFGRVVPGAIVRITNRCTSVVFPLVAISIHPYYLESLAYSAGRWPSQEFF
jgi:hypothetical protein